MATAYHGQPCSAIGSAALRGLVHEFTCTWVEENIRLKEERRARAEATQTRDEERAEMMDDKREAKAEARKQALLAEKQRDADRELKMLEMEPTNAAELALQAEDDAEDEEGEGEGEDGEIDADNMSDVSTDSEIDFERSETERAARQSDERIHRHINFAVGVCESEFDVEEWARHSDKAWYLGGNTFETRYGAYEGRASIYGKGVAGRTSAPVLGVGATVRIVVDLRPDYGRAEFWLMPEKDGLEEMVGTLEGLPLRKVALHPFVSMTDPGDVWELSHMTRRYDIEGDWIDRAGFEECKGELAGRYVDTEGMMEAQLDELRALLREAVAREKAAEVARAHQAELDAAEDARKAEELRLAEAAAAKEQAGLDALDPNLVGCATDGSVTVNVDQYGEGVYHLFYKPSWWVKDKTTMHTILLHNGEEVTVPWTECTIVFESDGSNDGSGSEGSGSDAEDGDPAREQVLRAALAELGCKVSEAGLVKLVDAGLHLHQVSELDDAAAAALGLSAEDARQVGALSHLKEGQYPQTT